ncbi:50S ribosomal protein L23 [Anaerobiospirillum sp. NML120448]|uniref:50S ribosomal protein L23 n=1 Tax=Anaerobiospirillum sp. NML120448 TaxID=2932816 RepID=UPI001FF4B0DC|nr:50S ribosomal protein L23 [Anaerobiospirillum sp. NML120448]MCK0515045.1 50S ribosomal protein L23 [Anaerobiospirillum sp. NML120448]
MMNARLMNILRAPIVTEKSARAEQTNTYVFKVVKDATKQEIKQAVETIFSVDVGAVRTLNVLGKKRRSAHGYGCRSDWKKAYVTLAEGEKIDFTSQAADKESN